MTLNLKTRYKKVLDNFKGFDFSSSPINVSLNRASSGKNFIYENGVNKKRNGYSEIFKIEKIEDGISTFPRINGIFSFRLNNEDFFIVYAGTRFYKVEKTYDDYTYSDITFSSTYNESLVDETRLKDVRAFMFKSYNKVYFIGIGDILVFQKYGDEYELRRVENDEKTFIPTTSVNILGSIYADGTLTSLDKVNVLTNKRINTFLGQDNSLQEDYEIFFLDSKIKDNSILTIKYKVYKDNETVEFTLDNSQDSKFLVDKNTLETLGEVYINENYTSFSLYEKNLSYDLEDNIKAYFEVDRHPLTDKILGTEVGTIFGINGRMDRLFLGGNSLYPNLDFYSESDDFTYFTDSSSNIVGSENSKIMGYSLLTDGTLAILKENNYTSPTIFYRTQTYTTDFSSDGLINYVNTYFPLQTGSIGEGAISKYAQSTLSNDKLFLSENGVYALILESNVTTNTRYSRERSFYINEKLTKHKDLSEAVAITYKNKYYLAIDDVMYVADARFKSTNNSILSDTYNYDWWYWENIGARVLSIVEDKLYFGTKDGRVCYFDETYQDKLFTDIQKGDLLLDFSTSLITYNKNLNLLDEDEIKLKNDLFCKILNSEDIVKIQDGKIFVNSDKIVDFNQEKNVLVSKSQNLLLENDKIYKVKNVNFGECSFELFDIDLDEKINLTEGDFCLGYNVKNKRLKLHLSDDSKFYLSFTYNNKKLEFNESEETLLTGKVLNKKNVVAYWKTPMLSFGGSEKTKTLLKLSLSTEPTTNGKVNFGYTTKKSSKTIEAKGLSVFNFDDFSFKNFTFNSTFANSYTIDVKDDFNYIQFYFESDTSSDCIIQNLTVIYKETKLNQGVE